LGVISFLLIMNRLITLVDMVLKYGVSPFTVARLVAYILPATFAITVPMSLLVAILMALGRLSSDMELTAIKAGGVSLAELFKPLLALSLLASLGMLSFNEYVLPQANLQQKLLLYDIVRKRSSVVIQEGTYIRDFQGIVIRVGKKDALTDRLEDITLFLLPKPKSPLQVVMARWGRLVSDPRTLRVFLEMHHGSLQALNADDPLRLTQMFFDTNVIDLDIQDSLRQVQGVDRKPGEMSIQEIRGRIAKMPLADPDRFSWAMEMHKKIAIPFACLAFALVGCPLGAFTRRGGRLTGFIFALLIIFAYYLSLSFGETYSEDGRLPPWLGMWLPNLLMVFLGGLLNWAVLKEKAIVSRIVNLRLGGKRKKSPLPGPA
jgi:lipopolysaccharide export system permease protein